MSNEKDTNIKSIKEIAVRQPLTPEEMETVVGGMIEIYNGPEPTTPKNTKRDDTCSKWESATNRWVDPLSLWKHICTSCQYWNASSPWQEGICNNS